MKQILIFVVRAYQSVLGPLLGGACRFHPSCSNYAIEAIERHGAARGAALAAKRLLRCRPFAAGGYDPVPDDDADVAAHFSSPSDIAPLAQSAHLKVASTLERAQ